MHKNNRAQHHHRSSSSTSPGSELSPPPAAESSTTEEGISSAPALLHQHQNHNHNQNLPSPFSPLNPHTPNFLSFVTLNPPETVSPAHLASNSKTFKTQPYSSPPSRTNSDFGGGFRQQQTLARLRSVCCFNDDNRERLPASGRCAICCIMPTHSSLPLNVSKIPPTKARILAAAIFRRTFRARLVGGLLVAVTILVLLHAYVSAYIGLFPNDIAVLPTSVPRAFVLHHRSSSNQHLLMVPAGAFPQDDSQQQSRVARRPACTDFLRGDIAVGVTPVESARACWAPANETLVEERNSHPLLVNPPILSPSSPLVRYRRLLPSPSLSSSGLEPIPAGVSRIKCWTSDPHLPETFCEAMDVALELELIPRVKEGTSYPNLDLHPQSEGLIRGSCQKDFHFWKKTGLSSNASESIECDAWIDNPVFFLMRNDATNVYHHYQDSLNTFQVYSALGLDAEKTQLVLVDNRVVDGDFVGAWARIFSGSQRVRDLRELTDEVLRELQDVNGKVGGARPSHTLCFRRAVFGVHGGVSPLSRNSNLPSRCPSSPLLKGFADFVRHRVYDRTSRDEAWKRLAESGDGLGVRPSSLVESARASSSEEPERRWFHNHFAPSARLIPQPAAHGLNLTVTYVTRRPNTDGHCSRCIRNEDALVTYLADRLSRTVPRSCLTTGFGPPTLRAGFMVLD
ncbi:hypothetical protein DFJ73DRAFT_905018 [Zopfochytrium polystomum]|nr:hypothetical protein DFJ73DRAFT_905018 [Zopfochytrium polystomum]